MNKSKSNKIDASIINCKWFLISEKDWSHIKIKKNISKVINQYYQSFSPQSVYYKPGSMFEYKEIIKAFEGCSEVFPDVNTARSVFNSCQPLLNYEFCFEGEDWAIKNKYSPNFISPFNSETYVFIAVQSTGILTYSFCSQFLVKFFQTIRLLNKLYFENENVIDNIISFPQKFQPLVIDLINSNFISENVKQALNTNTLPELLFLGHAGLSISDGDTHIVIDPVSLPDGKVNNSYRPNIMPILHRANYVVISHHHWDHLHYQTLCGLAEDKIFIIPKVYETKYSNPPMKEYLALLGFGNIIEIDPWDELTINAITLKSLPYYGESFGLNSCFDSFTYFIKWKGKSLFGAVDSCFDEEGHMIDCMSDIAKLGKIDFFFFGSSGQTHMNVLSAAGPQRFSNELKNHPELLRYHPNMDDVIKWSHILKPKYLIPYAQFLFNSASLAHIRINQTHNNLRDMISSYGNDFHDKKHVEWLASLRYLDNVSNGEVIMLDAMQGIYF